MKMLRQRQANLREFQDSQGHTRKSGLRKPKTKKGISVIAVSLTFVLVPLPQKLSSWEFFFLCIF